jgi:hypothetical protein
MFGNPKQKALNLVLEAMRPILKVSGGLSGQLPDGYWDDAFVIGFFNGYASTLAKVATQGKIKETELGEVLVTALETLAPAKGGTIARRMVQLLSALDPDAIKGGNHGIRCAAYMFNLTNLESDPAVIAAKELSKSTGGLVMQVAAAPSERLRVAGSLVTILYGKVLLERLPS